MNFIHLFTIFEHLVCKELLILCQKIINIFVCDM